MGLDYSLRGFQLKLAVDKDKDKKKEGLPKDIPAAAAPSGVDPGSADNAAILELVQQMQGGPGAGGEAPEMPGMPGMTGMPGMPGMAGETDMATLMHQNELLRTALTTLLANHPELAQELQMAGLW